MLDECRTVVNCKSETGRERFRQIFVWEASGK